MLPSNSPSKDDIFIYKSHPLATVNKNNFPLFFAVPVRKNELVISINFIYLTQANSGQSSIYDDRHKEFETFRCLFTVNDKTYTIVLNAKFFITFLSGAFRDKKFNVLYPEDIFTFLNNRENLSIAFMDIYKHKDSKTPLGFNSVVNFLDAINMHRKLAHFYNADYIQEEVY
jgi:hypothetical protein